MKPYFVEYDGADGEGYVVIADTAKEAKKIAMQNDEEDLFCDASFIDIKVTWLREVQEAQIQNLPKGVVSYEKGIARGLYAYAYYVTCPTCGATDQDVYSNYPDKPYCDNCEFKGGEE